MTPDQEPAPASASPAPSERSQPGGRGRRSGRGRRGRGRRRPQGPPQHADLPLEKTVEPAEPFSEAAPVESKLPPPSPREPHRAEPAAVHEAIDEVNRIIETLRSTLNDMEDVLETLELAERQKTADEQEIETLRRGLRQLHRPREGGHHPPRQ